MSSKKQEQKKSFHNCSQNAFDKIPLWSITHPVRQITAYLDSAGRRKPPTYPKTPPASVLCSETGSVRQMPCACGETRTPPIPTDSHRLRTRQATHTVPVVDSKRHINIFQESTRASFVNARRSLCHKRATKRQLTSRVAFVVGSVVSRRTGGLGVLLWGFCSACAVVAGRFSVRSVRFWYCWRDAIRHRNIKTQTMLPTYQANRNLQFIALCDILINTSLGWHCYETAPQCRFCHPPCSKG